MPTKAVVGIQWGDEGKGKIIDILASKAQVVVRSQGGNNAGHTVEHEGEVYKLRLIPSGILYDHTLNLIGSGTVIDPKSLLEEIDGMNQRGISCKNLRIDPRAHVVMPWHIELDGLSEDAKGGDSIGTTRRGIGPCYMDKAERIGLRIWDLINPEIFIQKATKVGNIKNNIITKLYNGAPLDIQSIVKEYAELGKQLAGYVDDVSVIVYEAHKAGKEILFEGAQGTLLDLDMGTYPFVTSSNPISAGACIGAGVGPTVMGDIIGVSKAYTTRVGEGPFPTEMLDQMGDDLRERGHEFGTNTGRPRRVGWFDALVIRHSVRVNGLTSLAVNKFDTLGGMETLKICVAYKKNDGTVLNHFPASLEELAACEPVYEDMPGFSEDISGITTFEQLPENCKNYVLKLEEICDCPIKMVGVGPARKQVIYR